VRPLNLNAFLNEYREKVNKAINEFLIEKEEIATREYRKDNAEFYRNLREFMLRGGKRLRPIAVILAYKSVKGDYVEEEKIIRASTCVEFLHNSTLIHDDIIDEDTLRRGGPTFHVLYEKVFSYLPKDRAKLYGLAFGIMGGDELFNLGFEALLTSGFKGDGLYEALGYYIKAYREVVNGELLDLVMSVSNYEKLLTDDYLLMVRLKTASLFEKSFLIGLALARASEHIKSVFSRYAISVAEAFQIRDDILGLYGEEKEIGKPVGSDIREGKATILVVLAFKYLPHKEKQRLKEILLKREVTKEDVYYVRELLKKYGILNRAEELSESLIESAKEAISSLEISEDYKELLSALAEFVVRRKY